MGLIDRISARRSGGEREITTLEQYTQAVANSFMYGGNLYNLTGVQTTLPGERVERIPQTLEGYGRQMYASNGIIFACMAVRQLVFSAVRFRYQRFRDGRPSGMFGNAALRLLEEPWNGGTTQDLLSRMIQDADLAGNFYGVLDTPLARLGSSDPQPEIVRLRPDWVDVALAERRIGGAVVGHRRIGYAYWESGRGGGNAPAVFLPEEIAHFAPHPDPLAEYIGMSWLTPVVRDVQGDDLMSRHKLKFFEHGATPNMVVKGLTAETKKQFDELVDMIEAKHAGVENAYRTLYLTAGADATVVGSDLTQLDFKSVQGYGETRIAAAAGVPAVIVGLSESMQGSSLTTGNYGQARRRLADGTMHPLWGSVAGSLANLVPRPEGGSRLWYDARDVPFLREDEKDAAEIQNKEAQTFRTMTDAGFNPESIKAAVLASDWSLLEHSGLYSVQLQPPMSSQEPPAGQEQQDPDTGAMDDDEST